MVRPTQGSATRYAPEQVPSDPKELPAFLQRELVRLQTSLNAIADGQEDITEVAPAKPREGMRRFADGTNWNPGSGRGLYLYSNAAWRFLG